MKFLTFPNQDPIIQACTTAIRDRTMITIVGQTGTGKTALVKHVMNTALPKQFPHQLPRILYICLRDEVGTSPRSTHKTLMTRVLFSEIALALGQCSKTIDTQLSYTTRAWYHKMHGTATDSQFLTLQAFVRAELERLAIDALIIDKADLLDLISLKRIREWSTLYSVQLGLILVATTANDGGCELTHRWIPLAVPDEEYLGEWTCVFPNQTDVEERIFSTFLRSHTLSPHTVELSVLEAMITAFWQQTQGDWHRIMRYSRRLGTLMHNAPQALSQHLWEQVFNKPLSQHTSEG